MCSKLKLCKDNENFIDFLSSDIGSQILSENMLSIHIETGNIFCENNNTKESSYYFLLMQQDETKNDYSCNPNQQNYFSNYLRYFLGDIDAETVDKFDFLQTKALNIVFRS